MRLHVMDFDGELDSSFHQHFALHSECTLGEIDRDAFPDGVWPDAFVGVLGAHPEGLLQQLRILYQHDPALLSRVFLVLLRPMAPRVTHMLGEYRLGGLLPVPSGPNGAEDLLESINTSLVAGSIDGEHPASGLLPRIYIFSHDFISQFPLGAIFISLQKKIVWCNTQAPHILSDSRENIVGKHFREVFPPAVANSLEDFWNILTSPDCIEPLTMSAPYKRKLLHATLSPILHEGGLTGIGALFSDQSFENDLGGLRGFMLRQIAEDILTQLDGLTEGLNLVKENANAQAMEATSRFLTRLFPVVQHVERLSANLLQITQEMTQRGETRRMFDFAEVINDILAGFTEIIGKKNLTIKTTGLDDFSPVSIGDPRLLKNTCYNLFRNTLRYALPDTIVSISLVSLNDTIELVLSHKPKTQLTVEQIESILQHQRRQGQVQLGNILNLKAMTDIVEMHGGALRLVPVGQEQMAFKLMLPAQEGGMTQLGASGGRFEPARFFSILAIEPEATLRETVAATAEAAGAFVRDIRSIEEFDEALAAPGPHRVYLSLFADPGTYWPCFSRATNEQIASINLSSLLPVSGGDGEASAIQAFRAVLFEDCQEREAHRALLLGTDGQAAVNVLSSQPLESYPEAVRGLFQREPALLTFQSVPSPAEASAQLARNHGSVLLLHGGADAGVWLALVRNLKQDSALNGTSILWYLPRTRADLAFPVRVHQGGSTPSDRQETVTRLAATLRGEDQP